MFRSKKIRTYFSYVALSIIVLISMFAFVRTAKVSDFLEAMEYKTFDLRQVLLVNSGIRKPMKDIVIVTIDDASYEYLLGKYGEWPIPRYVYADLVNYIEKQNPASIVFDLMFIKSMKSTVNADETLAKIFKKYDNVYTSMNFDNQSYDVRKPVKLDKRFSVKVKNDSSIDFSKDLTFSNCRAILPAIVRNTDNVGFINVSRSDDGILRKVPPLLIYNKDFYPHLTLMVALRYLHRDRKNLHLNRFNELELGDRYVPLDSDGGAILNWYGPSGKTFQEVPFYKIIQDIEEGKKFDYSFKNKLVYVGTTAVSLYDTKSVPVDKLYPGVEVHATYINNMIDKSFIKRVNPAINILISTILALLIGFVVIKSESTLVSLGGTFLATLGYIIFTYYMMKFFYLWIAIILPVTFILLAFVSAYVIKYVIKSRDFEQQYRLATTDGLTELYNHRYFQEQMITQIENCKRYNLNFSLILIDIDFFKKFNDIFGHQSGDAVLRQVAQKLKKNVRSSDFVCRYGGEEMSIILPNAERDEAIMTAQKICQAVSEKPFKLANDKESKVTISLGVSTYPRDGNTPSELIEHADQCLYHAKENGRNQVGF